MQPFLNNTDELGSENHPSESSDIEIVFRGHEGRRYRDGYQLVFSQNGCERDEVALNCSRFFLRTVRWRQSPAVSAEKAEVLVDE